jgi:hypothetical protein
MFPAFKRGMSEVALPITDNIVAHKKYNVLDGALFVANK